MAYLGRQPIVGNFLKLDSITTSATTTFNLTSGGVAYYPQTATNCIVSLNGVIQSPISAYTISGSTIVFSDALTSSDVIDFIVVLGDVLSIGTPSDNTVSLAKLTATGTKDSTTFLRGDNTFSTITSGLTEADAWRINATINFANTGQTAVTTNWERVDTDGFGLLGTGLSESSGVFSFPSTGYYYINFFGTFYPNAARTYLGFYPLVTLNNSTYSSSNEIYASAYTSNVYASMSGSFIIKVTDTANIKFKLNCERSETTDLLGSTSDSKTGFSCIKLAGI